MSSNLSGFYKRSLSERRSIVTAEAQLTPTEKQMLQDGLSLETAAAMIENVIGLYALPLGIATNFLVNGSDVLVPMVVEEPSIVAGVSGAARLARQSGGFRTESSEPLMIGQIQVLDVADLAAAQVQVLAAQNALLVAANAYHPTIRNLGGGAKGLTCHPFPDTPVGPMLVVHLLYDCRDAMGANAVNTAAEAIAPQIEALTGGRVNLRILSNLSDRRTARATCRIPVETLTRPDIDGRQVARHIVEAWAFAVVDPYRAATHNKGIMNGIDAVAVATGNDWRALEAGAHAFAARSGHYGSLTRWQQAENGDLLGELDMPLSVGTVGGATKVHPTAQVAMKILGQPDARRLAEIMVAVGLAQNLAALRALATDGIQRGHMRLHARQVALAAGAPPEQVQPIADQLVLEGNIRVERAQALLAARSSSQP